VSFLDTDKTDNFALMLYFLTPYSLDGNLGKAYNKCMELLPNDDDWACLTDGDILFLDNTYGQHIQECITRYPDTQLFTCVTNRVGKKKQLHQGHFSDVSDIKVHRRLAISLKKELSTDSAIIKAPLSGYLLVIQKKTWKKLRFTETKKQLGVDDDFTKRLQANGGKMRIMMGLYVFHYYRLLEGKNHKQHLK